MNNLIGKLECEKMILQKLADIIENKKSIIATQLMYLEKTNQSDFNIEHDKNLYKVTNNFDIYRYIELENNQRIDLDRYSDIYVQDHSLRILYYIDEKTLENVFYIQTTNFHFNYSNMVVEKLCTSSLLHSATNKIELLEVSKDDVLQLLKLDRGEL